MTANVTTTNNMKTLTIDVVVIDQGNQFKFKATSEAGVAYFESNFGKACCGLTVENYAFGYHFKKMKASNLLLGME